MDGNNLRKTSYATEHIFYYYILIFYNNIKRLLDINLRNILRKVIINGIINKILKEQLGGF